MSLQLDFSGVFEWAAKSLTAWEREDTQNEQGVSEGRDVEGSSREVQAMIVTETDFRSRFGLRHRIALGTMFREMLVGEHQRGPHALQMPLHVVRQQAHEQVRTNTVVHAVMDRPH